MSASSLRQRGSIAAVVATALLVTACGSSSSSGAAGTTSGAANTSAAAAATSAAGAAATSGAGAAATSAAGGAAATSKIVVPSAGAVTSVKATGGGSFCKSLAAAINSNAVTSGGTTPAQLKASIQSSLKVGLEALSKAPSAIKPDVKILIDASAKLFAALEKDGYDFTKLTPADEAAFSTPAVQAASTKVGAYVKADCGIDLTGGAAASSS